MGAPTVLPGGQPARAVATLDHDPFRSLEERMSTVCRLAVDPDEVAAYLEANGVNDGIAARVYGETSVFSLASRLCANLLQRPGEQPAQPRGGDPAGYAGTVGATLMRSALYLTPAVIAVGGASQFGGLPALAGVGALIYGWATAQALAFLGYRALGNAGPQRAARLLLIGFLAAAAGWAGLMFGYGVSDPRAHAVAAGQLALFAATAVALVTGTERRVLAAAVGVWGATLVVAVVGGRFGSWLIGLAIAAMLAVAYSPAVRPAQRFRPRPAEVPRALAHGVVGAGQAVLFASVVLAGGDPARVPAAAVPLLIGVPLAELILVWHQRRVAATRATLTDRALYRQRLTRVCAETVAVLAGPVLIGAALTAGGTGRLAAAVLLTSVYALCLVLVAHRRLGLAALLVWWPAALIGVLYRMLPAAGPDLVDTLVAVVLFAVGVPALGVVAMVLKDRWSYR
jgi:hypothetical protein